VVFSAHTHSTPTLGLNGFLNKREKSDYHKSLGVKRSFSFFQLRVDPPCGSSLALAQ
jgi:hypothetical protein